MKNSIKNERKLSNKTQKQIAKEMKMSRVAISNIETGKAIPSAKTVLKFGRVFNLPIEKLFTLENTD